MFSALKRRGVRLYRLARQGKDVPREPRSVRVDALELRKLDGDHIEFDVTCSRGTYVRTLAADMGKFLGCGAHLKSLRRISCGHLNIESSFRLADLEQVDSKETVPLVSLPAALNHLRSVTWESQWLTRLRVGQQEILDRLGKPLQSEKWVTILDFRGGLVALAEWSEEIPGGRWRLFRVFHD
jgi:tRNA pseudouridine55 synthase